MSPRRLKNGPIWPHCPPASCSWQFSFEKPFSIPLSLGTHKIIKYKPRKEVIFLQSSEVICFNKCLFSSISQKHVFNRLHFFLSWSSFWPLAGRLFYEINFNFWMNAEFKIVFWSRESIFLRRPNRSVVVAQLAE